MTRFRRVLALALLLGFLVGGVAVGAPGVAAQTDAPNASDATNTTNGTNATNDTDAVRHRDPETYNAEGNTEALRQRLAERLAARLQGSTANLSAGEFEAANASVSDEYNELLSQYVEVAGGAGEDTESAQAFESAAETQQEYVGAVARYREAYDAYQEAEAAGNTTRMRVLARELDRLAARINGTSRQLTRSFATVERTTGESTGGETVNRTTANVTARQADVSASLFVDTRLTLSAPPERVSFADPLPLSGRVVAENGTPLGNRTLTLLVGGARTRVTTDANGSFAFDYRPVVVPAGERTLRVAYQPNAASVYRRATANLTVEISPTDADLTVSGPESVRFAERTVTNGTLRAAGVPVPRAPIRVTLGDFDLGTVTTDANGSFSLVGALPAGVAPGEAPLTAEIAVSGRAVAAANATVPVRVRATDPALSLDAGRSNGSVAVAGRLAANGVPLSNRTVRIAANGTVLDTVRTGPDGSYDASFDVPAEPLALQATVDADGNLRDATANARLPAVSSGGGVLPGVLPWLAAAVVLLLSGAGVYAVRGRARGSDAAEAGGASAPTEPVESGPDVTEPSPDAALAARAERLREAGEFDAAVRTAYAAARAAIDADPGAATHWEFYRAAGLAGRADEALRDLTAAYERAAFAPGAVDEGAAADALDRLEDLR